MVMIVDRITWFLDRAVEYSFAAFTSWTSFTKAIGSILYTFTDLNSGLAWPFLFASMLIAGGVFIHSKKRGDTPAQSFGAFLFPRHVYGHPSALVDYKLYVINTLFKYLLLVPIMAGIGMVGYKAMTSALIDGLSWTPPRTMPPLYLFATAFGWFLLYDFINYCSHVLFHKVPILWSFHQVHHSAEVLTPITAYRAHPMELLVPAFLQAPAIGLVSVFYQNLLPHDMEMTMVFGVSLFPFVFALFGHHLQHSHVWLSFGPWLSRLYISPAQHQIHHSSDPRHRDKNFGVKFAVWDALFGTLYIPKAPETIQVGLPGIASCEFSTVRQLYFLPFRKAAKEFIGLALKCMPEGLFQERYR